MEQTKALIVYASMTGCNEDIAFLLSKELESLGVKTDVAEVDEVNVKEFLNADICIVTTYSYECDDEILPEEMVDFYRELGELNLTGKVYGTLGSGQEFYHDFCGAVDKMDEQFKKTGAIQGSLPLKIDWDITTDEDKENLTRFAQGIVEKVTELNSLQCI